MADGEDAIGLDQKPEGTGKPDRSASAPRHRVGVAGGDSTPCMSGVGKNNASGADRAGSVWIVGKPEVIQVEPVNNDKSACRLRLSVTAGAFLGTTTDDPITSGLPVTWQQFCVGTSSPFPPGP